jgi:hypothetical protein
MGLEKAGLADVRPPAGTYGRYAYDVLPPTPPGLNGTLAWLAEAPHRPSHVGQERLAAIAPALAALRQSVVGLDLRLPVAFEAFVESPHLHARVRSPTDCFIDISARAVPSPAGGYLARFMADSQGCLFWYLYLRPGSPDPGVVVSDSFFGPPEEQWEEPNPNPEIEFVAESFEVFLWRFWLESEIWFAAYLEKKSIPETGKAYVQEYLERHRRAG